MSDMTIVKTASRALVAAGASENAVSADDAKMERLRRDREVHGKYEVWTKEPHGGPYKKVHNEAGYDPLLQLPDGSDIPTDLGYERVKIGPTSNFVGDAMTLGAVDLVCERIAPPKQHSAGALLLESGDKARSTGLCLEGLEEALPRQPTGPADVATLRRLLRRNRGSREDPQALEAGGASGGTSVQATLPPTTSPEAVLEESEAYWRRGDAPGALSCSQDWGEYVESTKSPRESSEPFSLPSLGSCPALLELCLLRARCHRATGDLRRALASLDGALGLEAACRPADSAWARALEARARLWEELERPSRALADARKALGLEPANAELARFVARLRAAK